MREGASGTSEVGERGESTKLKYVQPTRNYELAPMLLTNGHMNIIGKQILGCNECQKQRQVNCL